MTKIPAWVRKSPLARRVASAAGIPLSGDIIEALHHKGEAPDWIDTDTPLQQIFWNNQGRLIDKWLHYIAVYERYFARFVGTDATILEIGVQNGGSMDMWRQYFGPEATLVGIDIDRRCAELDGVSGAIRIGSQADPAFLARVIEEFGPFDLVIDDGSHVMKHIKASFSVLFPHVKEGGLYFIEDLHCAYWPRYGGGIGGGNFFNDIRAMIDDMHAPYHGGRTRMEHSEAVDSICIHDSIVVIEKRHRPTPVHTERGTIRHIKRS